MYSLGSNDAIACGNLQIKHNFISCRIFSNCTMSNATHSSINCSIIFSGMYVSKVSADKIKSGTEDAKRNPLAKMAGGESMNVCFLLSENQLI